MSVFESTARFVLKHRGLTAIVYLLLIALALPGVARLQADFSLLSYFGTEDVEREYLNEFIDAWGDDDDISMIVIQSEDDTAITTEKRLNYIDSLVLELEEIEFVVRIQAITNVNRIWASSPGVLRVEPVISSMPYREDYETGDEYDRGYDSWIKSLTENSVYVPNLLSMDGHYAVVGVELDLGTDDIVVVAEATEELRKRLAPHQGKEGLTFKLAGIPTTRADFISATQKDSQLFVPIIIGAMSLVLIVTFRRGYGIVVPVAAAAIPVVFLLGLMGYTGAPITIITMSLTTLLPVIAVADAIHLVNRFEENLLQSKDPEPVRNDVIVKSCGEVGKACLFASITTAVGFFSFVLAEVPSLVGFGIYASIGILFALATVVTMTPLLLSFWAKAMPRQKSLNSTIGERFLGGCCDIGLKYPVRVLAGSLLIGVLAVTFGSQFQPDVDLKNTLHAAHPTTAANNIADASLGGIVGIQIDIVGTSLDHPEVLKGMHELEGWIADQPGVRYVVSPATYISRTSSALFDDGSIPETSAGVSQLSLLIESDPDYQDLTTDNGSRARIVIGVQDRGTIVYLNLVESIEQRLNSEFRQLSYSPESDGQQVRVAARITGKSYAAYRGIQKLTGDIARSIGAAFVVIAIAMFVLYRSPLLTLIAMVPNVLTLAVALWMVELSHGTVGPSAALVFTAGLALAVDDTIHLLSRYREELRANPTMEIATAISRAVRSTGRAIWITTLILAFGFGINMFSSFPEVATMGALGATLVVAALVVDVLLVPALLILVGRTKLRLVVLSTHKTV